MPNKYQLNLFDSDVAQFIVDNDHSRNPLNDSKKKEVTLHEKTQICIYIKRYLDNVVKLTYSSTDKEKRCDCAIKMYNLLLTDVGHRFMISYDKFNIACFLKLIELYSDKTVTPKFRRTMSRIFYDIYGESINEISKFVKKEKIYRYDNYIHAANQIKDYINSCVFH
jgi:hypothetical protein